MEKTPCPTTHPRSRISGPQRLNSALIELANAGKPRVRVLRRVLDMHPEIWQEAGDLALLAQRQLIQAAVGTNQFGRESLEAQVAALKTRARGHIAIAH